MRIIRRATKKPAMNRTFAKRRFSEGEEYESLESFHEKLDELEQVAQELVDKYGKEVTDNMNVIFWAKDENGTPILVEGAYNYWSGDEEITISEIAAGERPVDFEKKLKKAFIEIPEINYQIAVEEDDFPDPEVEYLETFICFGWEYATTKQGNLYMQGRVNHVDGPDFGEVFVDDGFAHSNLRDYDGDHEAEDINEKGLQKLAKAISSGTTEQPRFSRSKLVAKKSPKSLRKRSFAKRKFAQRSYKDKEIFELETKEEKEAALNAFFGENGPIGHTMIESADFFIRRDVIKTIPNTQIVRTSQDLLILLDGEQIADLFFYVRLEDVDIEVRCVDESGKKFDAIWMEYYPTKESKGKIYLTFGTEDYVTLDLD